MRSCLFILFLIAPAWLSGDSIPYPIVDTGQTGFYDDRGMVARPSPGDAFYGQDAHYAGRRPSYRDNGDGTVTDLNTDLVWQQDSSANGKVSYREAVSGAADCRVGGFEDWRLPAIKELYSLIDFSGGMGLSPTRPYIETAYFDFEYGDSSRGEREIDVQYFTATEYVGTTMGGAATVFGVNFADGRIKGYPRDRRERYVRYVRGNPSYGRNDFLDNGDGTVTDRATGLMWAQADSGFGLDWESSLALAEGSELAGYSDWRLPDAKELQSIVDYTRAPDAGDPDRRSPAIDPIFQVSDEESYYWTGTSHLEHPRQTGAQAVYICFGRSMGYFAPRGTREKQFINVHGAGAQRSDPKSGDPSDPRWSQGRGPQGDDVRILNYVRLVRGGGLDSTP